MGDYDNKRGHEPDKVEKHRRLSIHCPPLPSPHRRFPSAGNQTWTLTALLPKKPPQVLGDTKEKVNDGGATASSGGFEVVYTRQGIQVRRRFGGREHQRRADHLGRRPQRRAATVEQPHQRAFPACKRHARWSPASQPLRQPLDPFTSSPRSGPRRLNLLRDAQRHPARPGDDCSALGSTRARTNVLCSARASSIAACTSCGERTSLSCIRRITSPGARPRSNASVPAATPATSTPACSVCSP